MQIEIERKLNKYIEDGCIDEKNVLCILVYIRKLLECKNNKDFKLIEFYCNWALHIEMSRSGAKDTLKKIEDSLHAKFLNNPHNLIAATNNFSFISFRELKRELILFLDHYRLLNFLVTKDWSDFKVNLLAILKDSPLLNKDGNVTSFRYINHELKDGLLHINCELDIKEGFLPIPTIIKQNITIFD